MKCPNCKTELSAGPEKRYETLLDHVSDPNADGYPERPTFICENTSCELHKIAFWDEYGDFYCDRAATGWAGMNRISPYDRKTHKNKGTAALGSPSDQSTRDQMKDYQGFRYVRNMIRNKIGNWSCELRRRFLPTALWRDNNKWWRKMGYSFGVFLMDPIGNRWKWYAKRNHSEYIDSCISQWLYHPLPWVRMGLRRFLKSVENGKRFLNFAEKG